MKRCSPLLILLLIQFSQLACASESAQTDHWPAVTQTAKPWTRWWWPGSAVEKRTLHAELASFAELGLGGVEITPIYAARDNETRNVAFLSPRWMQLLEFTGSTAKQLGLGVDMATGTGWPFGGPLISAEDGSQSVALAAGRLGGKPTQMKVKRAAPGGEGLVLDPYSTRAMDHYLEPFSKAFENFPRTLLRSQFHDSFEYYGASWTDALPRKFEQMHGYDIQTFAPELMGERKIDADTLGRVRSDYRQTLATMHYDYMQRWIQWSHAQGFKTRNQAHGAPANLLDLYGAVDIPETETMGALPFPIPGLQLDPSEVRMDAEAFDPLVGRFASSAGHVMGRPLISSEMFTWLRENFKERPVAMKPQLDRMFAAGINHVVYHGSVYSPSDAAWPGWLFYAATQFNANNPLWNDFAAINRYVTRVQSVLQAGEPDNEIVLYWPFADLLDVDAELVQQLGVEKTQWIADSNAGHIAQRLTARGFGFDFISDQQLLNTQSANGSLQTPGQRYRVLIVPHTRRMPIATLAQLQKLARRGVPIILDSLPDDVPGNGRLAERRAEFAKLRDSSEIKKAVEQRDLEGRLSAVDIRPEGAAGAGLSFIRRRQAQGHDYFIANLGARAFEGWISLSVKASHAMLLDPLNDQAGLAALRPDNGGRAQIYLQLAAGESVVLRTTDHAFKDVDPWRYARPASDPINLQGTWQIDFIKGGPQRPASLTSRALQSWTEFPDPEASRFSGTARYRLDFDAPESRTADDWLLDLGDIRETARVHLNGTLLGTVWSLPSRVRIPKGLLARHNRLEIEVTNLAANRIRDLDRRGVNWKIMKDINLVDVRYKPFDASNWALTPSGLLGPVSLVPLEQFKPH